MTSLRPGDKIRVDLRGTVYPAVVRRVLSEALYEHPIEVVIPDYRERDFYMKGDPLLRPRAKHERGIAYFCWVAPSQVVRQ